MGEFIVGVVVDVCGHVFIQDFNGRCIMWIPGPEWDFVVLDAAEFVVLNPKVGLEYFRRRCEPEQGCVSRRYTATRSCRGSVGQQSGADGSRSNGERFAQKGTATDGTILALTKIIYCFHTYRIGTISPNATPEK